MEVENILPQSIIRKDAEAFDGENEMPVIKDGFRLLSIGRYCIAKILIMCQLFVLVC